MYYPRGALHHVSARAGPLHAAARGTTTTTTTTTTKNY